MCVVSSMGDFGMRQWQQQPVTPAAPFTISVPQIQQIGPTRAQFEAFLDLLKAAMKFDEATGQKECEAATKTAWIQSMCDHFGMQNPLAKKV